jgi:hypothetical protein
MTSNQLQLVLIMILSLLNSSLICQPGRSPSIIISASENIYNGKFKDSNISFSVFSFNDSVEYAGLNYWKYKGETGAKVIDDVIVHEIWNVSKSSAIGIIATDLKKGSIIEIALRDTSNHHADSLYKMMRIYVRIALRPSWDYEIHLTNLDSVYSGDFFYDMCSSLTKVEDCKDINNTYTPFPHLYENGVVQYNNHQELDLSCLKAHQIIEDSIFSIVKYTNCD